MKTLEKTFTSKQFNHNQIKRIGNLAIYKRGKPEHKTDHYEVIKITSHNGYVIAGQHIAPSEVYPGASMWGVNGFTCLTIEDAEKKFKELLSDLSESKQKPNKPKA